jgi:hypothetical protein
MLGLGLDWGVSTFPGSIGNSSTCGSEELAEGEVLKRLMSSAEDNSVVPCAGNAIQTAENRPPCGQF